MQLLILKSAVIFLPFKADKMSLDNNININFCMNIINFAWT